MGFANGATSDCSQGSPYVFANISFYIPWILGVNGVLEDILYDKDAKTCRLPSAEWPPTAFCACDEAAAQGRFPYSVNVRRKHRIHICQGALIGPRHVLTSGKCVSPDDYSPSDIEAYIGGVEREPSMSSSEGEMIGVEDILYHPAFYSETDQVDLAILVLEKDSSKQPIRLPIQSEFTDSDRSLQ